MTKYYCGIDPGKQGAIAFISDDGSEYFVDDIDLLFCGEIRTYGDNIKACGLEKVHAMPAQGVVSMFSMGENYGRIQGVLFALDVPYMLITPQIWQKGIIPRGLDKKTKKKEHVKIAQKMFPNAELYTPRGRALDGRADALLIADYVRRIQLPKT